MLKRLDFEYVAPDLEKYYDEFWRKFLDIHGSDGGDAVERAWLATPVHRARFGAVIGATEWVLDQMGAYGKAVGLEVGAGIGTMTRRLVPMFYRLYAADVSTVALDHIDADDDHIITVKMSWKRPEGIFRKVGFPDVVIASEVLEHMLRPRRFLRSAVKRSAAVVLSVPITEDLNFHTFDLGRLGRERAAGDAVGHVWVMDWEGFIDEFLDGFTMLREPERVGVNGVAVLRGDLYAG